MTGQRPIRRSGVMGRMWLRDLMWDRMKRRGQHANGLWVVCCIVQGLVGERCAKRLCRKHLIAMGLEHRKHHRVNIRRVQTRSQHCFKRGPGGAWVLIDHLVLKCHKVKVSGRAKHEKLHGIWTRPNNKPCILTHVWVVLFSVLACQRQGRRQLLVSDSDSNHHRFQNSGGSLPSFWLPARNLRRSK